MTSRLPEARKAHWTLNMAIRRGFIKRPETCEECGRQPELARDINGHHRDYAKPLEVQWLCRQCHAQLHTELRKAGLWHRYAKHRPKITLEELIARRAA